MLKKNRVGGSDLFFLNLFFILQLRELGFWELSFVIFLYLFSFKHTFNWYDDIIPFGSRGRQNFYGIINLPIKSFRVWAKNRVCRGIVNTHFFGLRRKRYVEEDSKVGS